MSDLISREAVIEAVKDYFKQCLDSGKLTVDDAVDTSVDIYGIIKAAPCMDAVPVPELLKLRDWLYESDGISMGNLRKLNELIAKYSSSEIPRLENGYERM